MAAPDFKSWFVHGVSDQKLKWTLTTRPSVGLVLTQPLPDLSGERVLARFTYSVEGTDAMGGREVGRLDVCEELGELVPESELEEGEGEGEVCLMELVEVVICSCEMVVQYWRGMGKHFRNVSRSNDGQVGSGSR